MSLQKELQAAANRLQEEQIKARVFSEEVTQENRGLRDEIARLKVIIQEKETEKKF